MQALLADIENTNDFGRRKYNQQRKLHEPKVSKFSAEKKIEDRNERVSSRKYETSGSVLTCYTSPWITTTLSPRASLCDDNWCQRGSCEKSVLHFDDREAMDRRRCAEWDGETETELGILSPYIPQIFCTLI